MSSIRMAQPSLLLNSYAFQDLGTCGMHMQFTRNCPRNATANDLVSWIIEAWRQTPDKHLHNVVLNFHGKPGQVYVGESRPESGFGSSSFVATQYNLLTVNGAGVFSRLYNMSIGTIWFHSCAIAGSIEGKWLCQRIAREAGCNVVAAEEDQEEYWGPLGYLLLKDGTIDDFEGPVYIWTPDGDSRRFNPNGGHWNSAKRPPRPLRTCA